MLEPGAFAFRPMAGKATIVLQMTAPDSPGTSCSMCGISVAQPPLTWMLETDSRRGSVWVCDSCARENLRAIESKLDQAWW
jgi:hypothetical protein